MRTAFLAVAALALMSAQKPVPLATPTGKWVVDFGRDRCVASHGYQIGNTNYLLAIQAMPTTDDRRVFIEVPRKVEGWHVTPVRLSIGDQKPKLGFTFAEPLTRAGYARYQIDLKDEDVELFRKSALLSVETFGVRGQFRVGNLASLEQVLKQCEAGLLESWGFSREAQSALATFPKIKNEKGLLKPRDYPAGAIRKDAVGAIDALLNVDQSGRVTSCRLVRASGHELLDSTTCRLLQERALFDPAVDRSGKAMAAPYYITVRWWLP